MSLTPEQAELALLLKLAADQRMDITLSQVTAAWSRAWDEIAQEWREALEELADLAEDGQWPSRGQIARSVKAQRALEATAEALQALAEELQAKVAGDLPELVRLANEQHRAMLLAQLPDGYDLPPSGYDARAVAAMVERTSQSIVALALPLTAEAEAAMRSSLIRGMAVGENPRKVAANMLKRVQGEFEGGRARAENIARTEMIDSFRTAAKRAQDANADLLSGWEWTAALNERTCPSCLAMHGQVFPLEQEGPWDHPSGRCARTPITKTWAELGFTNIPEPARTTLTGPQWFEQQTPAVQKKILGPKRYEAWLAGNYPPEAWSVLRDNADWRPSYGVSPVPEAA